MRIYFIILALIVTGMSVLVRQSVAESFPPITNEAVNKECSDCHMVYFAEMLPRRSWMNILNNLSNHFGEDASVDPKALTDIIAHHVANASDVVNSRGARKWREGLNKNEAPKRITLAPRFIRKHDDGDFTRMWKKLNVKSKADCVACHEDAQKGIFED